MFTADVYKKLLARATSPEEIKAIRLLYLKHLRRMKKRAPTPLPEEAWPELDEATEDFDKAY